MSASPLPFVPPAAFRPSAAQRRLLDFIHENPSFRTILELCAQANVPRRTYYSWCQDPAFRLWLATAWSARLLTDGVVLLNIARAQSVRSFRFWKALFDLTFDPQGLGFLQQWQQNLAAAANTAFVPAPDDAPDDAPDAQPEPDPASGDPLRVQPAPESNQQVTPTSCSDFVPVASAPPAPPRPHHVARRYLRALPPLRLPRQRRHCR